MYFSFMQKISDLELVKKIDFFSYKHTFYTKLTNDIMNLSKKGG